MRRGLFNQCMHKGVIASILVVFCFLVVRITSDASVPKNHVVRIQGFEFHPKTLHLRGIDTVTWINDDIVPHIATAVNHNWTTGQILTSSQVITHASDGGTQEYYCEYHPEMRGKLVIKSN